MTGFKAFYTLLPSLSICKRFLAISILLSYIVHFHWIIDSIYPYRWRGLSLERYKCEISIMYYVGDILCSQGWTGRNIYGTGEGGIDEQMRTRNTSYKMLIRKKKITINFFFVFAVCFQKLGDTPTTSPLGTVLCVCNVHLNIF